MSDYVISRRNGNWFTVAKFEDNDFPERVATVNLRSGSVDLGARYPATESTRKKYLDMVKLFVQNGEQLCSIRSEDEKLVAHLW